MEHHWLVELKLLVCGVEQKQLVLYSNLSSCQMQASIAWQPLWLKCKSQIHATDLEVYAHACVRVLASD